MKEFDGFNPLGQRQWLINRMFPRDCWRSCANSGERHVRPKRPLVPLPKCEKKRHAQGGDFVGGHTRRPKQTRSSRLRTVADMLENQGKTPYLAVTLASLAIAFGMEASFHGGTSVR